MGKILYYTWIGISIAIGLPFVILIIFGSWVVTKYQELTCKNGKCKMDKKVKKKSKKKLFVLWVGFLIGVLSTLGVLALTNHLK